MKGKIIITVFLYTCLRTIKYNYLTCPEGKRTTSGKSGMVFPHPSNSFSCITVSANVVKQREAEVERQELLKVIEDNRRIEDEKARKFWDKQHNYQSDLVGQIEYNQRLRQDQFEREEREYIKGNCNFCTSQDSTGLKLKLRAEK